MDNELGELFLTEVWPKIPLYKRVVISILCGLSLIIGIIKLFIMSLF